MENNSNRRNFLKLFGITTAGIISHKKSNILKEKNIIVLNETFNQYDEQVFNMCGYAAPKTGIVRVGFIGLGNRGPEHLRQLVRIDGVAINALCDLRMERVEFAKQLLENTSHKPKVYTGDVNNWKRLCEQSDIDLIYIATSWDLHVPMALYAMQQGKHVAIEVPAAKTIDQCWQLVNTSEKTKKHCVLLENCCYDFFELLTLNMARQGFLGEIIHCEGAYLHYLLQGNFAKNKYWDMWRLKENATRNGNLYPTHGLGPISQIMNLNRGDKMEYLVSMSSNDFMMKELANKLAKKDSYYDKYQNKNFRGNINTSIIRTHKGKTIMIQHDVSSPRAYSRIHLISGTKACAQKYPLPGKIALAQNWELPEDWEKTPLPEWIDQKEMELLEEKYKPEIVKKLGVFAKEVGGHGGMDFLINWRLIDCLRNGLPVDIDVYDTALWSALGPLSEASVLHKSSPINVPDFTRGSWSSNKPIDISLQNGGTTKVL